ncbi:MAG: SufD family Fe-S cluster assembly protein, partial [Candidatus Peribacteraceae bacterium]|nr:SufD family Fe-S cluster assembly protein [Candidatus Peribacteraceae bacterium]
AVAGKGQVQDTGAKVFHSAPHTTSTVVNKSLSKDGGRSVFRGMIHVAPQAKDSVASMVCDALLLDEKSSTETIPSLDVRTDCATVSHEAKVGKLSAEDIFYVMSRGLSEEDAKAMIVNGFLEPIIRQLPLEYAIEMNRLIEMEMEGSVG